MPICEWPVIRGWITNFYSHADALPCHDGRLANVPRINLAINLAGHKDLNGKY